jgi:hypothetical protein
MKTTIKKSLALTAIAIASFGEFTFAQNVVPATGNVGIGTTSPTEELDVNGNARISENITIEGNTTMQAAAVAADLKVDGQILYNGVQTTGTVSGVIVLDPSTKALKVIDPALIHNWYSGLAGCNENSPKWTSGLNKLYVECSNTNVGIGTTNPTYKLQVMGTSYLQGHVQTGGSVSIGAPLNAFGKLYVKNGSGGQSAAVSVDVTGNTTAYNKAIFLQFSLASTELIKAVNPATNHTPFVVNADGSMALSNTTRKIFQVNTSGLLQARQIKVDAITWADFVFDKNYVLMPINELRQYISENQHLPSVPSAETVATEGIDLAEMNKILLQKIEELTLYMLQQQKQIDTLQSAQGK